MAFFKTREEPKETQNLEAKKDSTHPSVAPEHWHIGGAIPGFQIITTYRQTLDELGYSNIKFSVFDHHFGLKWAGGRPHAFYPGQTKETFAGIVAEYNRRGIGFELVFSNLFVDKEHLDDPRCNWVLENCYRPGNGVIVSSNVLAEYIKKNYPNYKLIHSLTHGRTDPQYFYDLSDLYDVFVLPPIINYRTKVLKELLEAFGSERIEVIANETCFRECKYRREHYEQISKACLEDDWDLWEDLANGYCQRKHAGRFQAMQDPNFVKRIKNFVHDKEEIDNLKESGIVHFKLANRQIGTQQFAQWMNDYIVDRHNLSTTFYVYQNYYRPTHSG